jgi:hypothetical protein
MKITTEEQQKRSERARIKAYKASKARRSRKKGPKQKQGRFKNMRLVSKSSASV